MRRRGSQGGYLNLTLGRTTKTSPKATADSGPATARPQLLPTTPLAVAVTLAALTGASLALRLEGLGAWLWMDEGISVGIASHRLVGIPGLLVKDGSPPLYYVLLHGWMALFGRSETATHSLSLALAVAAVPVALWAGWSLFGARVGWILALLAATSPFLGFFATETRMYSLAVVVALVATAAYLHAFAFDRARYVPLFVGALVLLLYTHNWALYLALALAVGVLPCALVATDRRVLLRRGAVAFGAAALAYVPWVPTLVAQARHTAAPWSPRPAVREVVSVVAVVLGDTHERVLVALVLTAGIALATIARRRDGEGASAVALTAALAVTVGAGWVAAQLKPAWSPRYLAVVFPALLLLAALGLARSGLAGIVALLLILAIWTQPFARLSGDRVPVRVDNKAVDREIGAVLGPRLRPGDLVIAAQMEEVPVLRYYLGPRLRYANPAGVVSDPWVADWRDAPARMAAARPGPLLALADALPTGGHVVLVCPSDPHAADLPWFRIMNDRCADLSDALSGHPGLHRVTVPALARLDEGGARFLGLFERVRA